MKKLFATFFVGILLFSICGVAVLFEYERYVIRTDVENLLAFSDNLNETHIVKVSTSDYYSLTLTGREIRFDGKMYDIKNSVKEGDSVTLYCINDAKEEWLFEELGKFYDPQKAKSTEHENQLPAQIAKFFSLTFLRPQVFSTTALLTHTAHLQKLSVVFPEVFPSYDFPPPKS